MFAVIVKLSLPVTNEVKINNLRCYHGKERGKI